jgi:acyl-CoA reductase-like NAD-dependent aldehyde dehydrogenase
MVSAAKIELSYLTPRQSAPVGVDYHLFVGVYYVDFSRAMRVARKLDVGDVLVNNYYPALLRTPLGGVKDSGYGRGHWIGTMREWRRVKNIRFPSGLSPIPAWSGATDVCRL